MTALLFLMIFMIYVSCVLGSTLQSAKNSKPAINVKDCNPTIAKLVSLQLRHNKLQSTKRNSFAQEYMKFDSNHCYVVWINFLNYVIYWVKVLKTNIANSNLLINESKELRHTSSSKNWLSFNWKHNWTPRIILTFYASNSKF
jgi:hypothetical protein